MNKQVEGRVFQENYLKKGVAVFENLRNGKDTGIDIGALLEGLATNASIKNFIAFNAPIEKEHKTSSVCLVKMSGHMAEPYVVVINPSLFFKYAIYHLPPVIIDTFDESETNTRDKCLFNLDIALHRAKDVAWCEANCSKTLTDDFKKTLGISSVTEISVQDFGLSYNADIWHVLNITYKDINPTTPDVE